MKTILINVFDTAVAKNIFMPGFIEAVQAVGSDVRCIVSVPASKLEEFRRDYSFPGAEFISRPQKYASRLENLALFAARNCIPTRSERWIQETSLDGSGGLPLPRYIVARVLWLLGHSYTFRAVLKRILPIFFRQDVFTEILLSHKPDLVFSTTVYAVDDLRLLRSAKCLQIKTVGMIKSWDNLSSKDLLLIPPDRLIVGNDVIKNEAMDYHRYPADQIDVVGIPQFDWYTDRDMVDNREAFFANLGINPIAKLITYAAMGRWLVQHERDIIAMLYRLVTSGRLRHTAQLLVRMHPAYPDDRALLKEMFPNIVIDEPGSPVRDPNSSWKADWKFSTADIRKLATTLHYSDVTVNCGSTMILDAACFDTPIVGIAFDGDAVEPRYWRSAERLFEREHCVKVLETGGVRLAKSEQELIEVLNEYLSDKSKDSDGRRNIVLQQAGEIGRASARLAQAMLAALPH